MIRPGRRHHDIDAGILVPAGQGAQSAFDGTAAAQFEIRDHDCANPECP